MRPYLAGIFATLGETGAQLFGGDAGLVPQVVTAEVVANDRDVNLAKESDGVAVWDTA